jgi:CubicO group peptidase (beta-lactamase class C family)
MNSFYLFVLTGLVVLPAGSLVGPSLAADDGAPKVKSSVPDTPAGRQFAAWLAVFNRAEPERIRRYVVENSAKAALERRPADEQVQMNLFVHHDTGGLDFARAEQSSDHQLVALARTRAGGDWLRIGMTVEKDPPYRISEMRINRIPQPDEDAPHGKLSQEAIIGEIESYIHKLAAIDRFSGSVLIAKDGRPIFTKVHGMASRGYQVPNRLDTKFNLGSMNKMFTAVCIAQLVEQGKLAYDDHINKHLPDYPNSDAARKVTIHHLLTHTSGLGDFFNDKWRAKQFRVKKVREYFPFFAEEKLKFEPGSKWSYSNAGFMVLGAIVEQVSGQDYFDYVREHVYKPAGMVNTDAFELDHDVPNLAIGYTNRTDEGRFEPGAPRNNVFMHVIKGSPAGGGYSTVEDLLKFDQALRRRTLLTPQSTEVLWTGKVESARSESEKYAYGFFDRNVNGERIVGHSGGFPGISSDLDMYLDSGYTVVVMSNYDMGAQPVVDRLRNLITRK